MSAQAVSDNKKKGRPATGEGLLIGVRLQPDLLDAVDEYRRTAPDSPTRPEAIRRILADRLLTVARG